MTRLLAEISRDVDAKAQLRLGAQLMMALRSRALTWLQDADVRGGDR